MLFRSLPHSPSTPSVWTRIFSNRHARLLDPANYVEMSTIDDQASIIRTDRLIEQLRTLQESHNKLVTEMSRLKSTPSELSKTPPPPSATNSESNLHDPDTLTQAERDAIAVIHRARAQALASAKAPLPSVPPPPRVPPANSAQSITPNASATSPTDAL